MARPKKDNLDYFSHDCDMRNDVKIKALRRKFSHTGYSIYVMMLEYLGNCNYLQYEWNDLSIELLTPEFDIDAAELKEIINYCVFLKLFQVEEGIIYCHKFYDRNQQVLKGRDSFDLKNSPLMKLKRNKLSNNVVNPELTLVNPELIHKVKESKLKETKEHESKQEESKQEVSKEELIKRKYEIGEALKKIFPEINNITKLLDKNDLDPIQRSNTYQFNLNYQTILEYQSIKL